MYTDFFFPNSDDTAFTTLSLLINSMWWTFSYGVNYPLKTDFNGFMIVHHLDDFMYQVFFCSCLNLSNMYLVGVGFEKEPLDIWLLCVKGI